MKAGPRENITPFRPIPLQVPEPTRRVWNRLNQIMSEYRFDQYPDPQDALILAGEASLDATRSLTGYPQGLPCWRVHGRVDALADIGFWREYDADLGAGVGTAYWGSG